MKKILAMSFILLIGFTGRVKADEGMWLLPLIQKLNIGTMQEMGLKLTPEQIYSVNHSSLKDAVVIFGGGCTGELISDQGLILTNHHCGYDKIQELSTLEHNYLDDGFWAGSMEEEIPAPGLTVTFLKKMEDVTSEIMSVVTDDMNDEERGKAIQDKRKELIEAASKDNNYRVQIKDYFAGNQYFLIVYEVFTDVRFVGAPPSAIGKFGFDTDNWMWPRHTGDFSMFRVYADSLGNPADYSVENVPYQPAYHLPISLKGYEKEDFAMTIGFPGSTERYLPSWGIEERMKIFNQTLITVRGVKQDIWAEAMSQNDKIRLQYASKFSRSSNYWKNSIGMNRGLEALNVIEKKKALESEFDQWVNANESRKEVYGEVLSMLEKGYSQRADAYKAYMYLRESFLNGTEIYMFSLVGKDLVDTLKSGNQEEIDKQIKKIREAAKDFYKNYDAATDQKVMVAMLNLYRQNIATEYLPKLFNTIDGKYKGNTEKYVADIFKKSIFASPETLEAFLANPKPKILKKDMALNAANTILDEFSEIKEEMSSANPLIRKGNRLFMAGIMEMHPEKVFYPDANFTMRLSYGTVGDYKPRDAVRYNYFTTLKGVMEKEDPDNFEFNVPAKLKALYKARDYGRYADKDGLLHVNFTTNNDITGGNSGSPVINANGELFGLAFDGNWEAMSGDIAFETELQKCINVDIRYVLFIIDKYAGATRLIDEMTIIE